jgi:hypothetical protein
MESIDQCPQSVSFNAMVAQVSVGGVILKDPNTGLTQTFLGENGKGVYTYICIHQKVYIFYAYISLSLSLSIYLSIYIYIYTYVYIYNQRCHLVRVLISCPLRCACA